jgi:DNA mismatch repair protein MutS
MNTTPLLRQYFSIKEQYPNALLLFQVGDFYELFFEDAQKAAAFLGIALTKRGFHNDNPVPLCGVPVHALDHYLVKLVKGGFHVVICDQLEPARPGKIVERGVTQVLTPGTLTDVKLLQEKSASYCAAIVSIAQTYGVVFIELLTGHLFVTIISRDQEAVLDAELRRFSPDEIIISDNKHSEMLEGYLKKQGFVVTCFGEAHASNFFSWFENCQSTSFDLIKQSEAAQEVLKLLHAYLQKNQEQALPFCKNIFFYSTDDFLMLDAVTQRNLELIKNTHDGSSEHTLFWVIDRAVTSMGSRMLKKWLMRPLIKQELIEQRLDIVELLVKNILLREEIAAQMKEIGDIERVVGRIALNRAQLHDYRALLRALQAIPFLVHYLSDHANIYLIERIVHGMGNFQELRELLQNSLNDNPEQQWLIKVGYHTELDRLRTLMQEGAQAIAAFEKKEQERTGIQSLKVRYNQVHGYAIEVTKTNIEMVPADYVRMQTLVNRERFTTQALKDLEYDILRAQQDGHSLEQELYEQVCSQVAAYVTLLRRLAQACAQLDAFVGLATVAYEHAYVRPTFHEERDLIIESGRHPVVAAVLQQSGRGTTFIPNDLVMTEQERTWIITGPNMGGKSTFLRQVALISIMAHMGSFVSAQRAQLPMLDRIFTRIGAADNVAQGKSTFLVEMEETAIICNQATEKSLVILDEVGRGTSTYDGLAIAQAVVEYLHEKVRARALFATHYHELTALAETYSGIAVYHAASKKTEQSIVLLHKIIRGVADGSFGLDVARGALLPQEIVNRADMILQYLKQKEQKAAMLARTSDATVVYEQMQLHAAKIITLEQELCKSKELAQRLAQINYETLSPKQAFDLLWELKQ